MMNNQEESDRVWHNEETSGLIMVVHASNFIVGGEDNLPGFKEVTSSCLLRVFCFFFRWSDGCIVFFYHLRFLFYNDYFVLYI